MPKANQKNLQPDLRRQARLTKQREYDKKRKKQCPICQKCIRADYFPGHARRKHPNKLQELNVKPKIEKIGPPYTLYDTW